MTTPQCLITATRYLLPQSRNSFSISTAVLIAFNRFDRGFQRKPNQFEGNAERTLTKLRQSEYQIDAIWMFSLYSVAPAATIWNRLIADGNETCASCGSSFGVSRRHSPSISARSREALNWKRKSSAVINCGACVHKMFQLIDSGSGRRSG